MGDGLEGIWVEIESLAERMRALGERLKGAGDALAEQERVPDLRVVQEIIAVESGLGQVWRKLCLAADSLGLGAVDQKAPDDLRTLRDLFGRISTAQGQRATLVAKRDSALCVLERVWLLDHSEHLMFEPLENCQEAARDLHLDLKQTSPPALHPAVESLCEGTHPFAVLLAWVENQEQLDDQTWQRYEDIVKEAFGRLLATAVNRGRIRIQLRKEGEIKRTDARHAEEHPVTLDDGPVSGEPTAEVPAVKPASDRVRGPEGASGDESDVPILREIPADATLNSGTFADESTAEPQPPEVIMIQQKPEPTEAKAPTKEVARHDPETAASVSASTATPDVVAEAEVLDDATRHQVEQLESAFWRLLDCGRYGLAFHIAAAAERIANPSRAFPPAWLARSVALAPELSVPNGDLALQIQQDIAEFDESLFDLGDQRWKHGLRFILAAACLRPALIAPETGAASVLHGLRFQDGLASLYRFSQALAEHANHGMPLSPAMLSGVRSKAAWEAEAEAFVREVKAWWSQAGQVTILYAPATSVWRAWLKPGGAIHDLLLPVRENNAPRRDIVNDLVDRFADESHVKEHVRYTDRRILNRKAGKDIHARALTKLLEQTREAVGLARRWLALQERNPDLDHKFVKDLAEKVRCSVMGLGEDTLGELKTALDESDDPVLRASIRCCTRAIEDIILLFDPESRVDPLERTVAGVLNRDLLYADVLVGPALEVLPGITETETANAILTLPEQASFDAMAAFERKSEQRDHVGTSLVLEHLPLEESVREQLSERRNAEVARCKEALARDLEQTANEIEAAVGLGLLREAERNDLVNRVETVKAAADGHRFAPLHDRLAAIRLAIRSRREEQVAEVEARLAATEVEPATRTRIRELIRSGDVLTANEYIDLARDKRSLPEQEKQPDPFLVFLHEYFGTIERFLEPPDTRRRIRPNVLVRDLRAQAKRLPRTDAFNWPVPVGRVRGKHLEQAAAMLESWFTMKQAENASGHDVQGVLAGVGMVPRNTRITKNKGRRIWFDVECEAISDRERCPVPFFGSHAHGKYTILCVWDRPAEADLLADVGETAHAAPTIVFYFGRMTPKQRTALAELCSRHRRTFVVVDDIVMLHLCAEPGPRLPTMFRCTLPFTFLEPYAATAGLVPREMFYGREAERNQIVDINGSCFIYGGRQLGKTALLRDVERTFHDPARGKVGLWLDLKSYGIGVDRPVDELWHQLSRDLKRFGVIPQATPAHASTDKIISHIQDWIESASEHRVLLLLDESDRFLELDGLSHFSHTARLKGLMDRTQRRFKVVFAGLHNVQRTTRLENNPLAHYGEPICIGPLLDKGELRQARRLIEEPFACAGYVFESPALVMRILSQTNYYPSLIQLYCNQLLRHLHERRASRGGPPIEITSRDLEEAYQSQDLRRAIRDRFTWTLDLDPRYRLIAFSLALNATEDPKVGELGMSVADIRNDVFFYWARGFREVTSEDVFRVLLDEMVGLGVLRPIGANHYGLRSLNVTSLLGTQEEIEAELMSFELREPPPPFEPAAFRAAFRSTDGQVDPVRRNPLSAAQESELRARKNGVSIILGCAAGGLDDVEPFLRRAFGETFVRSVDGVTDVNGFLARLKQLDSRERNGVTLVLVTSSSAWTPKWVENAIDRVAGLTSRSSFVRIAFVADPNTARYLAPELEALESRGVTTFHIAPWQNPALQQWLDDAGFAGIQERDRQRIRDVTGNWPVPLGILHQRCHPNPHQWAEVLSDLDSAVNATGRFGAHDVASLFGLQQQEEKELLADLAEVEEASAEDLRALRADLPLEVIRQVLHWGISLGFVRRAGGDRYAVDSLLGRMLVAERGAAA